MGFGSAVRARLGRFETPVAEAYRRLFIDLDSFATLLGGRYSPRRVLEIGCGDGAMADRLVREFPEIDYLGIDVSAEAGRRYTGDPHRAEFATMTSADLVAASPEPFDLVVVVDVLHHVPSEDDRRDLLRDAATLSTIGGTVVVKEWASRPRPGYSLAYFSDRYVSGDRTVRFCTREECRSLVRTSLPGWRLVDEATVRPWPNNVVSTWQRK